MLTWKSLTTVWKNATAFPKGSDVRSAREGLSTYLNSMGATAWQAAGIKSAKL